MSTYATIQLPRGRELRLTEDGAWEGDSKLVELAGLLPDPVRFGYDPAPLETLAKHVAKILEGTITFIKTYPNVSNEFDEEGRRPIY